MKHHYIIIALLVAAGVFFYTSNNGQRSSEIITSQNMEITSTAFVNNDVIPGKYTCDAENVNPELLFSNIPVEAKSLALIVHDPDAPREGGWTHWTVINMETDTTGIAENTKPTSGMEAATSFEQPGYGGPCPPTGSHRYFFYLYALDTMLSLDASAGKAEIEEAMSGHIIETAQLIGTYQRQ